MKPAPPVTVVIPARNAAADIGGQLAALGRQTASDFEVVVSDNGSTDGTAEAARAHAGDLDLRVVDSSDRAGVSHARNVGMASARGSAILICDADDEVDEGWVTAMSAALEEADLVSGHLDVARINPPHVAVTFVGPAPGELPVSMGFLPYGFGGNLGLRREVLERVGDFDESYAEGHEDVEYSWRAQLAGVRLAAAPEAVIHYRLRGARGAVARRQFRSGRSYARLFSDFRGEQIPRTPARTELRFYARLLASLPRDARAGRAHHWVDVAAWTAGRLAGDVRYRVRCPL